MGVPVKGRTILGLIAALLLVLPLVLLLGFFWRWMGPVQASSSEEQRHVPVLVGRDRRAIPTIGRTCQSPKDCDPPSACVRYFSEIDKRCVVSHCETDAPCPKDYVCRTRKVPDENALIRQCVFVGTQQEGQPCFISGFTPEEACAPGLYCDGYHCGRPCELDAPAACPEGFVCRAGLDTPFCQPSCRDGDCAEGQECVVNSTGAASCMRVNGADCQRSPCPEGQRCHVSYTPGAREWTVNRRCETPGASENL